MKDMGEKHGHRKKVHRVTGATGSEGKSQVYAQSLSTQK